MKIKLLKILSVILCVCVVIALFFATTRVSDITVQVAVSETVQAERVDQALNKYLGKNIIALNKTSMIKTLAAEYPSVKVTGIVKKFPNQVIVQVRERKVLFAVKTTEGYDFIDEEGVFLGRNAESDAFGGFTGAVYAELPVATNVPGSVYVSQNGYTEIRQTLVTAYTLGFDGKELSALLRNVVVEEQTLKINTKSGAVLQMDSCAQRTAEKAQYLFSAFVAGSDAQKLSGKFLVFENKDGKIEVQWTA